MISSSWNLNGCCQTIEISAQKGVERALYTGGLVVGGAGLGYGIYSLSPAGAPAGAVMGGISLVAAAIMCLGAKVMGCLIEKEQVQNVNDAMNDQLHEVVVAVEGIAAAGNGIGREGGEFRAGLIASKKLNAEIKQIFQDGSTKMQSVINEIAVQTLIAKKTVSEGPRAVELTKRLHDVTQGMRIDLDKLAAEQKKTLEATQRLGAERDDLQQIHQTLLEGVNFYRDHVAAQAESLKLMQEIFQREENARAQEKADLEKANEAIFARTKELEKAESELDKKIKELLPSALEKAQAILKQYNRWGIVLMKGIAHMLEALALIILIFIHLFANKSSLLGWVWHGRFLSFASGISFAYVFIDLLPTLDETQPVLKASLEGVVPYINRHAYVIALLGVLFAYGLQSPIKGHNKASFWLSMAGYALFNLFVGASLSDPDNPDIKPLPLFVIAVGFHYFVHDHNMKESNPELYTRYGKWILAFALLCGWIVGYTLVIPEPLIATVVAFIAGGMLLNVMHYELPKRESGTYPYFVLGSLLYSVVLLSVGIR